MSNHRRSGALREFRRRVALTQQELADRAGLSVGALRDLEQGRVTAPRPDTLRRLAAGLRLSNVESAEFVRLAGQVPEPGPRLRVLGPLALQVDGAAVDLGSDKQRTLLALLALHPNTPVHLDTLVDAMWGDAPPATAATLVQSHVSRLRRRIRPDGQAAELLAVTRGGYQLTVADDQLDLSQWRRLLGQARAAYADDEREAACDWYHQAAELWRGEPVADLAGLHAHPAVVALGAERHRAVVEFADVAAALGHHDRALPALRQLTDGDPLHEAAHARLMIALAGSGQQAAALRVYDALRHRLADLLGADPSDELAAAHRRVLRQEVTRTPEAAPNPVTAHRQLPPDIADFTGREPELDALRRHVAAGRESGAAPVIAAIEGMAGVGKTRLAVHLAHQLVQSGQYGDVQLYADLRGHAAEPPAGPAAVLASFLRLLGVPGSQVPDDLDGRAALYRDRLHDRHALVLLDNAADDDQVRPLLPATGTGIVLVTSRRTLALDGAHTVPLDVFSPRDAQALLARVVGGQRVAADPDGARDIVDRCGRLPLAVVLAASRLRSRPAWRCADLAARLAEEGGRLGELAVGTRQVRAVFDLSYDALDPASQRLFRLLGLHPGDDFTAASAAALAGLDRRTARRTLDHLVDEHLVTPVAADRFRLHDLLREYATGQAATYDGDEGTTAAVGRVLAWYLHSAEAAARELFPHHLELRLDEGARSPHLPAFADDEQALRWLTAEHATLVAAVSTAVAVGRYDIGAQLPLVLRPYFAIGKRWGDWSDTSRIGLVGARRGGDRAAEARLLKSLGIVFGELGRYDEAVECITRSLDIRRALGDRKGEASCLNGLGVVHGRQGNFTAAIGYLTAALDLHREFSPSYDQTMVLNNLGRAFAGAGRHQDAIRCLQQVIEVRRRLDDQLDVASALFNLGEALASVGRYGDAVACLQEGCAIYRDKHCPGPAAETLEALGDALLASGDPAAARGHWHQALSSYDELSHPRAEALRAKLDA